MRDKIIYYWYNLKGSFWFVPLSIIIGAIVLTNIFLYLDTIYVLQVPDFLRFFFNGSVDAARSVLVTIAGSMVGVAGTVFSITLVALTMASGQFGPRLLQNFMYDRINQIVLGTYIANFICSLITLRAMNVVENYHFIPNITISVLIAVAIANIFLLIIYIHHISVSIQADSVIDRIGTRINKKIETIFPQKDNHTTKKLHLPKSSLTEYLKDYHCETIISSDGDGYIESINEESLVNQAEKNDCIFFLKNRPGDFVVEGMPLLSISSKNEINPNTETKIKNTFMLGNKRSSLDNVIFEIEQITEVALRALSPGINDPNTGLNSIDRLFSIICKIIGTEYNSAYIYDDKGKVRVFVKPLTFNFILDTAFSPIRFCGKDNINILLKLMRVYSYLYTIVTSEEERETLKKHAERVYRAGENHIEEKDEFEYLKKEYLANFGNKKIRN